MLVLGACGGEDDDRSGSTSVAPTTARNGTTVITTGTTQTTEGSSPSSETTTEPIPPVTPPASQPEACVVLAAAAGLDPGVLQPDDRADGEPAPSTGCRASNGDVSLALFYGQDPLETLALVRVQNPVGSDATGLGQDAYESRGVLYVDAGSRAFAVTGGDRSELVALAQAVLANL
jgi:hypothetical protein